MATHGNQNPPTTNKPSAGSYISTGKDLVALLRDLALFVLAVLLLLFPTTLNSILTNAGFEEGSLAGFKWKSKFVESDVGLKEARIKINDLQSQLNKTQTALAEAESKLNDPAFRERVAKLEEENRQLKASTEKVEASVSKIISTNAPLVEKAQTSVGGGANSAWGVIYSGDSTLAGAKYEVETIASKLGIPNARIYMDRNGSYRSVSVVDSSAEAEQVLAKAKQRRSDAYIVRMSSWCPNATDKGAYRECGSS